MDLSTTNNQHLLIETIFQNIPQYIFWKDTQSVYLGCNNNYVQLLGLHSPEDIIGKTDQEIGWLSNGDTADKFRSGDQETLKGRSMINEEECLSLPGGIKILTLVNKVPLINNGAIIGRILIRSATVKNAVYSMFYENLNTTSKETAAWVSIRNYRSQIDAGCMFIWEWVFLYQK